MNDWLTLHNSALIGFDEIFNKIKELEKPNTGFPVYDIIKESEDVYFINLAVAGFSKDELEVVLEKEKLTVSGNKKTTEKPKTYLFKGIAERNFKRAFTLVNTVEVEQVSLVDGILSIKLKNYIPEHKRPKVYSIA